MKKLLVVLLFLVSMSSFAHTEPQEPNPAPTYDKHDTNTNGLAALVGAALTCGAVTLYHGLWVHDGWHFCWNYGNSETK